MMRFPFAVREDTPLYLAPMAGVSESPFRVLCRRFGADVVVSEFLSAGGGGRGLEHPFHEMRLEEGGRPLRTPLYRAGAPGPQRGAERGNGGLPPRHLRDQ